MSKGDDSYMIGSATKVTIGRFFFLNRDLSETSRKNSQVRRSNIKEVDRLIGRKKSLFRKIK